MGKKIYTEEFKRKMVNLYEAGQTQKSIVQRYKISQSALTRWVKQYKSIIVDNDVVCAMDIHYLKEKNQKLLEENELLKKVYAIVTSR